MSGCRSPGPSDVVSRGHREPPTYLPCEHAHLTDTQLEELRKPTACRKVAVPPCLPQPMSLSTHFISASFSHRLLCKISVTTSGLCCGGVEF